MEERYDSGTRIWTTVFGVLVAAVVDWLAVVNPARGATPSDPYTGWWLAALIVVCIAPACWFAGRIIERLYLPAFAWFVVLAVVVNAQFITLTWAHSQ